MNQLRKLSDQPTTSETDLAHSQVQMFNQLSNTDKRPFHLLKNTFYIYTFLVGKGIFWILQSHPPHEDN